MIQTKIVTKVKIISCSLIEELESEINKWLDENINNKLFYKRPAFEIYPMSSGTVMIKYTDTVEEEV